MIPKLWHSRRPRRDEDPCAQPGPKHWGRGVSCRDGSPPCNWPGAQVELPSNAYRDTKKMKLRTIALVGVACVAGLGLVGTGAHAVFTQSATAGGTISVGTVDVQLSTSLTGAAISESTQSLAGNSQSLTFPSFELTGSSTGLTATAGSVTGSVGGTTTSTSISTTGTKSTGVPVGTIEEAVSDPVSLTGTATTTSPPGGGSTTALTDLPTTTAVPTTAPTSFTTGDALVVITNEGSLAVTGVTVTPGDSHDSSGSPTSASSVLAAEAYLCEVSSGEVVYNGPLSAAPSRTVPGALEPGTSDIYTVNIYAGSEPTACGDVFTPAASAPAADQTSPAPVLGTAAAGGVIKPTFTVTYTG